MALGGEGRRTRAFGVGDRRFEVRATPSETGWTVRVFEEGMPATPAIYSLTYQAKDPKALFDVNAVEQLMTTAQRAAEEGWDRLYNPLA